jgi:Cell division cycle-associated protein 8
VITIAEPNMSTGRDFVSSMVRLNVNNSRRNESSKGSSIDEGYKTDSTSKTAFDSDSDVQRTLESVKRRRRSKSVEPHPIKVTSRPQPSHYSGLQHLAHASRSKIRTPLSQNRHLKSNSSDRAYNVITPKVQPNTPLMLIRHARMGEQIFSLSGSPVVTSRIAENTANVNIPMEDDILSIRPIEMATVDPSMLERLKPETFEHLKRLKRNLDAIMRVAEEKWGHE